MRSDGLAILQLGLALFAWSALWAAVLWRIGGRT